MPNENTNIFGFGVCDKYKYKNIHIVKKITNTNVFELTKIENNNTNINIGADI